MRLLIDTNVLIPLEPDVGEVAPKTIAAAQLAVMAAEAQAQLLLHPSVVHDIARDRIQERRARLTILAGKYAVLEHPPPIPLEMEALLGSRAPTSNDGVDHQLLAAVVLDAVDFLVTEDQGLHSKARRLGESHRVLTVADAAGVLRALFDRTPAPPPAVELLRAVDIAATDPILDSLRLDYGPDFDDWLRKAKREGRRGWAIRADATTLAAVVLMKKETREYGLRGRLLKLSTFKVSEAHRGFRFGELLLKAVFRYASENNYEHIFVTVFEKHVELRRLLEDFGFRELEARTDLGELVLAKRLIHLVADDGHSALDYHIQFGPPAIKLTPRRVFIVPIRPEFHRMLFPEFERQLTLSLDPTDRPFGNALRKAYLSHAGIRQLQAGDALLFYRSQDKRGVTGVGVVEGTMVSTDPEALARFVAGRTVYRFDEIIEMAARPVLAVTFRQDRLFDEELSIEALVSHGVVERAPQTIGVVRDEGYEWLSSLLVA